MSNRCAVYVRVSTDDQRDNGYSIDSQLRMIKEYCEKNDYLIVDVYNDAGHSGKDLMRPEMQRLLKDIKSKKIDKLVAIKVDRLTRNNYDGFWLLNYCEEHDVKIELILEPYDVSTANGEMIFGMNLVFGQRERKEIGARTKRAMEEMALSKIHPSKVLIFKIFKTNILFFLKIILYLLEKFVKIKCKIILELFYSLKIKKRKLWRVFFQPIQRINNPFELE